MWFRPPFTFLVLLALAFLSLLALAFFSLRSFPARVCLPSNPFPFVARQCFPVRCRPILPCGPTPCYHSRHSHRRFLRFHHLLFLLVSVFCVIASRSLPPSSLHASHFASFKLWPQRAHQGCTCCCRFGPAFAALISGRLSPRLARRLGAYPRQHWGRRGTDLV